MFKCDHGVRGAFIRPYAVTYDFKKSRRPLGASKLVSTHTLEDQSSGLVVNDCCTLGVEITGIRLLRERVECLTLQEEVQRHEFTWVIKEFSK